MHADTSTQIQENVAEVRERMASAAERSGRTVDDVLMVAVTKYVDADVARAVVAAGCHDLGESRPQVLWSKAEDLGDDTPVRWHMIGHMQRNKLRRTLPLATLFHSADSVRLLEEFDRQAASLQRTADVLIEVNVSGDAAKHGFEPAAMRGVIDQLPQWDGVRVRGLMCMGAREGGVERARRDFAALRQLRDELRGVSHEGVSLDELSMGMSGDYEAAIEEGATMVRVGSVLFRGVPSMPT
jgi:pyridoxal phosphate enzyme (YggS family)